MNIEKDELISASELARRIDVNPSYITNSKEKLIKAKCTYGKKYYFRKSAQLLGKNPDNPHTTNQSRSQKPKEKKEIQQNKNEDDKKISDPKELLEQILKTINDPETTANIAELNGLKTKAAILREYFSAKNEEIKNKKLEENLYTSEEIMQIIGFAISQFRQALLNIPNNYAVNLENLTQKQIKEYVADDINKILENFQKIEERFE